MGQLDGRVALVTGGASGIGHAACVAYADAGAKVVVVDRDSGAGDPVVEEIRAKGGEAIYVAADVSDEAQVEAMVARAVAEYGRLDAAFNNAGISTIRGPIGETPLEVWNRVMAVNLTGVWLCLKHEIGQMLKQGGGAIVNTGSIGGLIGTPEMSPYIASKHGVIGLTRSLAMEYAQKNIRINAVCPGWTLTPMVRKSLAEAVTPPDVLAAQPNGRYAEPEEIAAAVVWLSSDAASFVTGAPIPVDGGYTAR